MPSCFHRKSCITEGCQKHWNRCYGCYMDNNILLVAVVYTARCYAGSGIFYLYISDQWLYLLVSGSLFYLEGGAHFAILCIALFPIHSNVSVPSWYFYSLWWSALWHFELPPHKWMPCYISDVLNNFWQHDKLICNIRFNANIDALCVNMVEWLHPFACTYELHLISSIIFGGNKCLSFKNTASPPHPSTPCWETLVYVIWKSCTLSQWPDY